MYRKPVNNEEKLKDSVLEFVEKSELSAAIETYLKMLYGSKDSKSNEYNRKIKLTTKDRLSTLIPLLPHLIRQTTPGLIRMVLPFIMKAGMENLNKYIGANLGIIKVQAVEKQNFPVSKIMSQPRVIYQNLRGSGKNGKNGKKRENKGLKYPSELKSIEKKLEKIIDLDRNKEMSSFERFHRTIFGKIPDRIPFAPLMDNFYARISGIPINEFVSSPYKRIFGSVKLTHKTFHDYFDMVHLPMGRIYSFFQPIPVAHSGFYAKLILPNKVGQVLQFLEKEYTKLEDFPEIFKNGFSSIWRKRPLRLTMETMTDFLGVGNFVHYWELKKQVPLYSGSGVATPLEALSYLIGIKSWSRAIIRKPEETLQVCESILPGLLANDLLMKEFSGVKRDYICLERVSPQFISPKAFELLVFPHLKRIVNENIKFGYINLFHMDTDWEPFLHYFAELPKQGKYIFHLEKTDLKKAKDIVGHMGAIMGNLEGNLLVFGDPNKIQNKVRDLITNIGSDGRLILSPGCHLPPDIPLENLVEIIKTIEKYGWY